MCKEIILISISIFLYLTDTVSVLRMEKILPIPSQQSQDFFQCEIEQQYDASAGEYLNAHYIAIDEDYNEFWLTESIYFYETALDDQIFIVYMYLFNSGDFFPPDTEVLSARIEDGNLILDVSDDILYYYSSYMDIRLRAQIIKTALDIPGINNITLLIEGELRPLPGGGIIIDANECLSLEFSNASFARNRNR